MRNTRKFSCYLLILSLGSFSLSAYAGAVATVNGKKITQKQYDLVVETIKAKNPAFKADENKQGIVNELISRELLFQEAKKQKIDKDPKVAFALKQQRIELMIQALIQKSLSKDPVKEKDIKKIYKEKVSGANQKEYKASHIYSKHKTKLRRLLRNWIPVLILPSSPRKNQPDLPQKMAVIWAGSLPTEWSPPLHAP